MYRHFSKYYDALLADADAYDLWLDFFNEHKKGHKVLELASGTGEISLRIAQNHHLVASDLAPEMIEVIKEKDSEQTIIAIKVLDMQAFKLDETFDTIVCFCDSINYILDIDALKQVFKNVYDHLETGGKFLFDMHTADRLEEFEVPFIEAGNILDTNYQWTIISEDDFIYHHFAFYEDEVYEESHTQRVYAHEAVITILEDLGFKTETFTDFDIAGVQPGEKLFIVGEKQ